MLDFGALPPEINSARIYAGPGPGSMLAAAGAWQGIAEELNAAATSYGSVVSNLTSGPWTGPSSVSMAAAAAPYVTWLGETAAAAEQAAGQVNAAVAAYEAAFAATVPPLVIAANRSLLAVLFATNFLGQNTPAIAATEAHYAEMWAQDAAAMYGYAGASAAAANVTPFTPPPQTTDPAALANQAAAVAQAAATPVATQAQTVVSAGPELISTTPQALQGLASSPALADLGSSGSTTTSSSGAMSSLSSLSMLAMPARMAMMPMSMLMRMMMMGGANGAAKAATGVATTGSGAIGSLSSGLGSGAGAFGPAGLTGLVNSGPAATAEMARAVSIGPLSVPQAWTAANPAISPAAVTLSSGATTAAPAAAAGQMAVPPVMPVAPMAARGAAGGPDAQYDFRPPVMGRSPIGG